MESVLFFVAAIGALGGAVAVIGFRNPFYSVLALVVHLFSLAVLFLLVVFLACAIELPPSVCASSTPNRRQGRPAIPRTPDP